MDPVSLYKAAQLVLTKGHAYQGYNRKYQRIDIKVWTKSCTDLDLLERVFGGQHYVHRSGFYWVLSERKDQLKLVELVRPWLTEATTQRLHVLITYARIHSTPNLP